MKLPFKWKVSSVATGRYRSFERRGWPSAFLDNDHIIFGIACEDDYSADKAKSGDHKPLFLKVTFKTDDPVKDGAFKWMKFYTSQKTLAELKVFAYKMYIKYEDQIYKG